MHRDAQPTAHASWWWSLAVLGLLLYPYLALVLLGGASQDRVTLAGELVALLSDVLLLGAGVALTVDARLTRDPLRGAMAVAATLVGVQDAALVVLGMIEPELSAHSHRLTTGHLATVVIVLLVVHRGRRSAVPLLFPFLVGLLLGLTALATTLALYLLARTTGTGSGFLHTRHPLDVMLMVLIGGVLAVIGAELRRSGLPAWASARIGIGILAIFAARLWSTVVDATMPPPLTIVGVAVFSSLTATTAATLLRRSLEQTHARVEHYARLAADTEAEVKQDREVAHEVRSLAAGIAAAAHLLASGQVPPGPRRRALERLVDSEAARLGRAVSDEPSPLTSVDVDTVVSTLVLAQGVRGRSVAWTPGGHRVLARVDALAEVLDVLLNNAADHAGGHDTAIESRQDGATVAIVVSDNGPGIDPELGDRLFAWGSHGTTSAGHGIGLHRARRLVLEQGGTLDLVDSDGSAGTTFVIRLPRADDPSEEE